MSDDESADIIAPRGTGSRSRNRVFIRGLELMASVGIFEVEKRYEQRIVISVDLDVADSYDGAADRLEHVVDYAKVVARIREIIDSRHFQLIETLAERIAEACFADARVLTARIAIEKPDIMPGCRSVGIAIERARA